jgi:ribose-phosphate pyrophosphokinase
MKLLNLDKTFQPFGESIHFESFTYSGGEPHIRILEELKPSEKVLITTRIRSFNDLGFVLLAADALHRMGIQSLELFIPYFPAARQDRVMVSGEPLSVKVMANLTNTIGFERVYIVDPHSEVTPALLDNATVFTNHKFVAMCVKNMQDFHLVSPDGGALKKIYGVAKSLGGIPVIEAGKTRDVATGKLTNFKVYEDDLTGKNCVVVDDICDGGGTFIGLAKELKRKGASTLHLMVTHGIFSKGFNELNQYYDSIWCTDSFSILQEETVHQIKLSELKLIEF